MANKFIIILYDDKLVHRTLRKPQAPRPLRRWIQEADKAALRWKRRWYIFRYGGVWHVRDVDREHPIKSFDNQPAAEMFLLHYREQVR